MAFYTGLWVVYRWKYLILWSSNAFPLVFWLWLCIVGRHRCQRCTNVCASEVLPKTQAPGHIYKTALLHNTLSVEILKWPMPRPSRGFMQNAAWIPPTHPISWPGATQVLELVILVYVVTNRSQEENQIKRISFEVNSSWNRMYLSCSKNNIYNLFVPLKNMEVMQVYPVEWDICTSGHLFEEPQLRSHRYTAAVSK